MAESTEFNERTDLTELTESTESAERIKGISEIIAMLNMEIKPREAAEYIGVSDDTIRNYVNDGALPARRQGKRRFIFIKLEDLQNFAEEYGFRFMPPEPEMASSSANH